MEAEGIDSRLSNLGVNDRLDGKGQRPRVITSKQQDVSTDYTNPHSIFTFRSSKRTIVTVLLGLASLGVSSSATDLDMPSTSSFTSPFASAFTPLIFFAGRGIARLRAMRSLSDSMG